MRSPEELFADLENDRQSREAELRLVQNFAASTSSELEIRMLRRSIILLTYAHFEGFCKFALLSYLSAINSLSLSCKDVVTPLAAASLSKVFAALRDIQSKHPEFANLPDDRELHMLAREQTFVKNFSIINESRVELADRLVDTRSNLNTLVLKRNLYLLGLDYPAIETHRANIDRLLGMRNAIAHGDMLKFPSQSEVVDYASSAFTVMSSVQLLVYDAIRNRSYLR